MTRTENLAGDNSTVKVGDRVASFSKGDPALTIRQFNSTRGRALLYSPMSEKLFWTWLKYYRKVLTY